MDQVKLSKVVSTKITEKEDYILGKIAQYFQARGYIAKANTAEVTRFLLRRSIKSFLMEAMSQIKSPSIVSESRNPLTDLGKSPASTFDKNGETGQRQLHDSTVSRGNISSTGIVPKSGDINGNSIGILPTNTPKGKHNTFQVQGVSAGSTNTENETQNAFGHMNNISRPADSRVSQVDKNLTDVSGPSLEFMAKYWEYVRQTPGLIRYHRYLAP